MGIGVFNEGGAFEDGVDEEAEAVTNLTGRNCGCGCGAFTGLRVVILAPRGGADTGISLGEAAGGGGGVDVGDHFFTRICPAVGWLVKYSFSVAGCPGAWMGMRTCCGCGCGCGCGGCCGC